MSREIGRALRGAPGIVAVALAASGVFAPGDAGSAEPVEPFGPWQTNWTQRRVYAAHDATVYSQQHERNDGWAPRMLVSPTEMALVQFREGALRSKIEADKVMVTIKLVLSAMSPVPGQGERFLDAHLLKRRFRERAKHMPRLSPWRHPYYSGVTYACPKDRRLGNDRDDCDPLWRWQGEDEVLDYVAAPSASKPYAHLAGSYVALDVTADVLSFLESDASGNGSIGWVIRRRAGPNASADDVMELQSGEPPRGGARGHARTRWARHKRPQLYLTQCESSEEICDNIDNDCDGEVDEGFDQDGDGDVEVHESFDKDGDGFKTCVTLGRPAGNIEKGIDCNDGEANIGGCVLPAFCQGDACCTPDTDCPPGFCGKRDNGCGGEVDCGCEAPAVCRVDAGQCCTPDTECSRTYVCGAEESDGCDGTKDCAGSASCADLDEPDPCPDMVLRGWYLVVSDSQNCPTCLERNDWGCKKLHGYKARRCHDDLWLQPHIADPTPWCEEDSDGLVEHLPDEATPFTGWGCYCAPPGTNVNE